MGAWSPYIGGRKTFLVFVDLFGKRSDRFLGGPVDGHRVLDDILQPSMAIRQLQGLQPKHAP